jgi:hypothetical protein
MTKGWRLQRLETPRGLRGAALAEKMDRKPTVLDRLNFWLSTKRKVDGLWVGTTESKPHPGLRRVEEALELIKHHDPLHYSRVLHNLEQIWVHLLPDASACYDRSTKACVFDERFVLLGKTTLERIASTIVHEATHARLEGWGVGYDDEDRRPRIEAICLRRELNFIAKLPHNEPLREEIERTLEWCVGDHDYFSDASFQQRNNEGWVETLRYLNVPDWLSRGLLKMRTVISKVRRLAYRFAGRPSQKA